MLNVHIGKFSNTVMERHNKKLLTLWKTERTKSPDCVKNLSNYKLTICEENALRLGLKHHILPAKINYDNIKVEVEKCVNKLCPHDEILDESFKDKIKFNVNSFVKSSNSVCSKFSNQKFHSTLKNLSHNKSIKIVNMDKGNGVVIMNTKDYYAKLDKIVLDKTKFEEIKFNTDDKNPIIKKQNSVKYYLDTYVKDSVDIDTFNSLIPVGSQPGKIYGMAKVHKEGVPLRPVVSMIKTSEYCLAKYLDTFIQPNIPISYSVNSTTQFLDSLKTYVFSAQSKIISFDVVSLFTNVPLEETINIICKKVYGPQSLKKPPFKQLIFKRMLFLACEGIFMYKGKYFKQLDGVAMGSPLGPSLANFFLGHLETTIIQNNIYFPNFYCRYVDDIFSIFNSDTDINNFFDFLNKIHPNMKFTKDEALNDKPFPFLNVEVKVNNDVFDSWIYRKPTNTNVFLNYRAIAPQSFKRGLILGFLTTAKRICSSNFYFDQEVGKLRHMLNLNGYPSFYFNKILSEFQNNNNNAALRDTDDDFVILKVPFVGTPSFEFSKRMRQTLSKKFSKPIKVIFNTFKVGQCFTLKCKTPKHLMSNVVYKFTCKHEAEVSYVGKTKRHLAVRVGEHLSQEESTEGDSQIKKHLSECVYCSNSNIDSFEIVKSTSSSFDVLIFEALMIKKLKPSLNVQLHKSGSFYTCKVY